MSIRVFNKPAVVIGGGSSATLSSISISSNGTYSASAFGVDGFDVVDVDVQGGGGANDDFGLFLCGRLKNITLPYSFGNGVGLRNAAFYRYSEAFSIDLNSATFLPDSCIYSCYNLRSLTGKEILYFPTGAIYDNQHLEFISLPKCLYCGGFTINAGSLSHVDFTNLKVCYGGIGSLNNYAYFSGTFEFPNLVKTSGFENTVSYMASARLSLPELVLFSGSMYLSGVVDFYAPKIVYFSARANTLGVSSICFSNAFVSLSNGFAYCSKLTAISFINTYASISADFCSGATQLSIVDGVLNINNNFRFSNHSLIKELKIAPVTLGTVNLSASCFANCSSLESLYILDCSIINLANANAFNGTPMSNETLLGHYGSIYVPSSWVASYKTATNWATYSDRITALPSEFDSKYIYALEFFSRNDIFEIPSEKTNVEQVLNYAFYSCRCLESISLPNCKVVGQNAFYYAGTTGSYYLSHVYMPECRVLVDYCFNGIGWSMSQVDFPKVSVIGSVAFTNKQRGGAIGLLSIPECLVASSCFGNTFSQIYAPKLKLLEGYNNGNWYDLYCPEVVDIGTVSVKYIGFLNGNSNLVRLNQVTAQQRYDVTGDLVIPNLIQVTNVMSSIFLSGKIRMPNLISIFGMSSCSCTGLELPKVAFGPLLSSIYCPKMSFKNCSTLGVFNNCPTLSKLLFENANAFASNTNMTTFYSCRSLESIYFFGEQVVQTNIYFTKATDVFDNTPIDKSTYFTPNRYGSIFVRASLLEEYKNDSFWSYIRDRFVGLTDQEIQDVIDHWDD